MKCPNCPRTDARNLRGMWVSCDDCGLGIWVPPTRYPWPLIIGTVIITGSILYVVLIR